MSYISELYLSYIYELYKGAYLCMVFILVDSQLLVKTRFFQ